MKTKIKIILTLLLTLALVFPIGTNLTLALNQANSPATVVIGQQSFGSEDNCQNAPNQGSSEKGMYYPVVPYIVDGKMIVSDSSNNRVLIYNSVPTSNNQKPDVVIGQPNLCSFGYNQGSSVAANTLYTPTGVYSDGTKLLISDSANNRILVYNSIPTSNNVSADVVIGQTNMISNSANQGGSVTAYTLSSPSGIDVVNGKLIVADNGNHRVLIYDHIPTSDNTPANIEIGQVDMEHNSANRGGSAAANSLKNPVAIASDGTQLLISDYTNNRVLIFTSIPDSNGASANYVIGQTTTAGSGSGTAVNKLKNPAYVYFSHGKLFISDYSNHRILIYNSIPAANNASANLEIGQADMDHGSANRGNSSAAADSLNNPRGVFYDGTKIFVADLTNNRVLIFNSYPLGNGASADLVEGQLDMVSNGYEQSGTVSANTLKNPGFLSSYGNKLFVVDYNNRILIFNSIPTSNNASADVVVGQSTMSGISANQGGTVDINTLSNPNKAISNGDKFLIADVSNNRVLIFNSIPTSSNASASKVIGQADMTHNAVNQGSRNSNTLSAPRGICFAGDKLVVSDYGNNRILIFNSIPADNNIPANMVIGQANYTDGSANRSGSVANNTLSSPTGIWCDSHKLIVADWLNHRVLIYNSIPTDINATADVVIGQVDMGHNSCNQGNSQASANTLCGPYDVSSDGTRLFISDMSNGRILVYNSIPTSNNASADAVVGQANMNDRLYNQGNQVGSQVLKAPDGVYVVNGKLFISDQQNHRILIYPLGPQNQSFSAPSSPDSRSIALTLGADDAKDVMMSEDSGFTGASWESYTASKNFTLSKGGGSKTVYVKMRDYANYEGSTMSQNVSLDNVVPVVTSNQSSVVAAGTTEVTLSVSSTKNTTCKYSTNSSDDYDSMANTFSSTGGTTHTTNVTGLTDGNTYNYYIKCDDPAGNEDSYTITFAVSPTEYVPTIFIGNNDVINLSPTEQAVTRIKEIAFRGTLTDNDLDLGKVELRKDGKFYKRDRISKKGKWRIPTKDNSKQRNTPHTYQFVYYDKSGNIVETSNTYTILIDRQKPKFTRITKTQTKSPGDTVTFGATDNDQIGRYNLNFRGQSSATTTPEFIIPAGTPKGTSILSVEAVDRAGNGTKIKLKIRVR